MGAWMLCSSLFLSVGLRNRQLLQVTFCRCAHFGAGKLNEILTVDFGNHCPARHRRRRSYRAACIAAFHMTGIEQSDAGSLTAICRKIGRAIIPALFFWFDVGQHHPRCQSKKRYGGYDDLFEKFFVHGYLEIGRFEKARRRQFSPEFS